MTSTPPTTKPPRARTRATSASASNGADRQIKIGEAARIIGVEAYVLRFWETQFPFLRPRHSHSKHRYYDEKSLDSLRLIRRLLHSEGYTIAGAKKHIREGGLDRLRSEAVDSKVTEPAEENRHEMPETSHEPARNEGLPRSTQASSWRFATS